MKAYGLVAFLLVGLLVGCGPSEEEQRLQTIAAIKDCGTLDQERTKIYEAHKAAVGSGNEKERDLQTKLLEACERKHRELGCK